MNDYGDEGGASAPDMSDNGLANFLSGGGAGDGGGNDMNDEEFARMLAAEEEKNAGRPQPSGGNDYDEIIARKLAAKERLQSKDAQLAALLHNRDVENIQKGRVTKKKVLREQRAHHVLCTII